MTLCRGAAWRQPGANDRSWRRRRSRSQRRRGATVKWNAQLLMRICGSSRTYKTFHYTIQLSERLELPLSEKFKHRYRYRRSYRYIDTLALSWGKRGHDRQETLKVRQFSAELCEFGALSICICVWLGVPVFACVCLSVSVCALAQVEGMFHTSEPIGAPQKAKQIVKS